MKLMKLYHLEVLHPYDHDFHATVVAKSLKAAWNMVKGIETISDPCIQTNGWEVEDVDVSRFEKPQILDTFSSPWYSE